MRLTAKLLLITGFLAFAAIGNAQPPGKDKGGKGGQGGERGGPGGPGGMGRGMGQPGQILPGFIVEQLKLTDDQKKQLATLQKEVDEKVEKLLTEDQKKQLKEMKDRGPGGREGGRPGAEGGRPGGGDRGGRPPEKKDN